MTKLENKIKNLRSKGYSGSRIAKKLHIRKQTALAEIRRIEKKEIQKEKVTVAGKRQPRPPMSFESKQFTDSLYRDGYPQSFIQKLVHRKHPRASYKQIKEEIDYQKMNPFSITERKDTQSAVTHRGSEYRQNRYEGKFYRETSKYFKNEINWDEYEEFDE